MKISPATYAIGLYVRSIFFGPLKRYSTHGHDEITHHVDDGYIENGSVKQIQKIELQQILINKNIILLFQELSCKC